MDRSTDLRGFLAYVETFSSVLTVRKSPPPSPSALDLLPLRLSEAYGHSEIVYDTPVDFTWDLSLFLSAKPSSQ